MAYVLGKNVCCRRFANCKLHLLETTCPTPSGFAYTDQTSADNKQFPAFFFGNIFWDITLPGRGLMRFRHSLCERLRGGCWGINSFKVSRPCWFGKAVWAQCWKGLPQIIGRQVWAGSTHSDYPGEHWWEWWTCAGPSVAWLDGVYSQFQSYTYALWFAEARLATWKGHLGRFLEQLEGTVPTSSNFRKSPTWRAGPGNHLSFNPARRRRPRPKTIGFFGHEFSQRAGRRGQREKQGPQIFLCTDASQLSWSNDDIEINDGWFAKAPLHWQERTCVGLSYASCCRGVRTYVHAWHQVSFWSWKIHSSSALRFGRLAMAGWQWLLPKVIPERAEAQNPKERPCWSLSPVPGRAGWLWLRGDQHFATQVAGHNVQSELVWRRWLPITFGSHRSCAWTTCSTLVVWHFSHSSFGDQQMFSGQLFGPVVGPSATRVSRWPVWSCERCLFGLVQAAQAQGAHNPIEQGAHTVAIYGQLPQWGVAQRSFIHGADGVGRRLV